MLTHFGLRRTPVFVGKTVYAIRMLCIMWRHQQMTPLRLLISIANTTTNAAEKPAVLFATVIHRAQSNY